MSTDRNRPNAAAAGTVAIGDLVVHRLGYGAMRITGPGVIGEPADPEQAKAVLRRAVELGVNFIDTADSYGPAVSERLIAEALYPYPAGLVIATKGGLLRPRGGGWQPDGRPAHLREALEGSLRRLRLERIDLYQLHRVDPKVPLDESLGALVDAQSQGKIRHIGVSNVTTDQLAVARSVARVVSVQNRYNLSDRTSDPVRRRVRARRAGVPALASGGHRRVRAPARPACGGDRAAPRSHADPGGAGVAAQAVAGDASDSRDVVDRPPRGEHRGRGGTLERRGVCSAVGRVTSRCREPMGAGPRSDAGLADTSY